MGIFNRVLAQFSANKQVQIANDSNDRLLAQINHYASLIRLQDERQLIEVMIEGQSNSFQSMIVGVDLHHQQLIIDELSPKLMAPETLIGQQVGLRHQHNRQMLKICSEIVGWENDSRTVLLDLPKTVKYRPRRQNMRVEMSLGSVIKAVIDPIYGAPWYASVSNISEGGMRILVTGDLRGSLHKNKPLRDCMVTLEDGHTIHSQGRVKAFSYQGRPYRRTEISIEFEKMSKEARESLQIFLNHQNTAA